MADNFPPTSQERHRQRSGAGTTNASAGSKEERRTASTCPTRAFGEQRTNAPAAHPEQTRGQELKGKSTDAPFRRLPAQRPAGGRQAYAAIDLGTNNCRLLIARPSGEHFVVIDAFSRIVRLGEGLSHTGRLSPEAMDRTVSALQVCADKLRRRNINLARSVATEACRRAANGAEFIDRVRNETDIALDIISSQEEARLAVLGCHVLLERGEGPAMIFDIGGGSTELVLIETGPVVPRILDWQSVPWGVVSLNETFPMKGGDSAGERRARYTRMRAAVHRSFAGFSERLAPVRSMVVTGGSPRLLGTSGTVTTLASLHLQLPQYNRRAVDGLIVPAAAMRAIATMLSSSSPQERERLPCIGRDRSELVVAGCAILETILDLWPAERLGVADRGIREGILRGLMAGVHGTAEDTAAMQPVPRPL
ncbi:Ppx/GppA phosphatase family protein [Croceicoccus sp. F390]|uniref:Ppx/GppA phosphatase family protein n=1 Tax=Croceicoccus esteveae TaxID=3075597 RepID=A0ABU2ZHQ0_9SPHN|nr:Ppx/GppA phosphatase family protein [Croceicoccus sp. F390]MDT0575824.1 Ppx/GppA phosphatase family protein [Croceicoccus sp. F390]